jgi:hypothetical protein
MGWGIRTVIETELAVIAFLFNFREILRGEFGKVAFILINTVNERIERGTQVKTPSTPVTDIENPLCLGFELRPGPAWRDEIEFWHCS